MWGCLKAIADAERDRQPPPTTFDIAMAVYRIETDGDGFYEIANAQHVAVKRALEGLQRKGKVIGFDRLYCRNDHGYDGRTERGLCWMSERGARQWIRQQGPKRAVLVKRFKAKAAAIGMTLDQEARISAPPFRYAPGA
jgi:hypothetical protein